MSALERLQGRPYRRKTKIERVLFYIRYLSISWFKNILIKNVKVLPLNTYNEDKTITVSLTSYPDRIHTVSFAIKSIMAQTVPPQRIILWLAESQFPDRQLPHSINELINLGLEVKYVDKDLRSHKKYFYALQNQKQDEIVITIDDDIIYHPKTIERLLSIHSDFPNAVVCNSAHIVQFESNNEPKSYSEWHTVNDFGNYEDLIVTPLTGSGCLYPYGVFSKIAFDIDLIKSNAYFADDLWIAAMIGIHNIRLKTTDIVARTFTTVFESQRTHLAQINCLENGNDIAIRNLRKTFPQFLYKKN